MTTAAPASTAPPSSAAAAAARSAALKKRTDRKPGVQERGLMMMEEPEIEMFAVPEGAELVVDSKGEALSRPSLFSTSHPLPTFASLKRCPTAADLGNRTKMQGKPRAVDEWVAAVLQGYVKHKMDRKKKPADVSKKLADVEQVSTPPIACRLALVQES